MIMAFSEDNNSQISVFAAQLAIAAAVVVVLSLVSLHFLSPEFDPSWRMVSEYANGNYSWVLSILFAAWAINNWALAYAIYPVIKNLVGRIGLVLLVLAGFGAMSAVFFDVNHPLHGLSFLFGAGGFPFATLFISLGLLKNYQWSTAKGRLILITTLVWSSVILMGIGMALFIPALTRAGVDMSKGAMLTELPNGVTTFVGWANRYLVIVYNLWVIVVARYALQFANAVKK
jgi:hypothetical protein